MPEPRLVSIVIDNCNYGRFLGQAIDSALAQTHPRVEVIVVDDGSTDHSRDVIGGYGQRIMPVLKANGGHASALNAGYAASRGDIVMFLDADDYLLPTAIEQAVACFDDPSVVKVHWRLWVVNEQGQRVGRRPGLELPSGDLRAEAFRDGPSTHLSAPTSGNVWTRTFLQRVMPIPEALYRTGAETYLFELAPFFGPIRAIREPQSVYRMHGGNHHSSMGVEQKIQRGIRFYENCCEVLASHAGRLGRTVDPEQWRPNSWWYRLERAIQEIRGVIPKGETIILIDDQSWEPGATADHATRPFLEYEGRYDGPPSDDDTAIRELERMRAAGATFLVVAWCAFWWLDHFARFARYLRERHVCVLDNERLKVFELRAMQGRAR